MYPYIHIGSFKLPTYGLCIAIGFLAAVWLGSRRSKKRGLDFDEVFSATLWAIVLGVVGAKLLFILTMIPEMGRLPTWQELLNMIGTGFVFYGGLIGALIGLWIGCRRHRFNMLDITDLLAPSLTLAHGFGRIGCFMAGCCYGVSVPWGVTYQCAISAPNGVPLLPIQLIEAACLFLLTGALCLYSRKPRRKGSATGLYFICYAVIRFVLEFFRGDADRGILLGISTSQWISVPLLILGVALMLRREPAAPQEQESEPLPEAPSGETSEDGEKPEDEPTGPSGAGGEEGSAGQEASAPDGQ